MKHAELCSIGHNLADSLASGISMLIGVHDLDVFSEAMSSPEGRITLDFLAGRITEGAPSPALTNAARLYAEAIPDLCARHGVSPADFAELTATFSSDMLNRYATVAVTDSKGRRSATDYAGVPLKRPRVLDPLGRIRRA